MNFSVKIIKLVIIFIILSFFIFSYFSFNYQEKQKIIVDKLIVAIDHNYPPYIFRGEDGVLKGYLVDLWREWEEITGVKVILYAVEWSLALQSMLEGKSDIIDTIFYTEERAKIYSYSKPYAKINVPIFYSNNISGLADYDSLKGFVVGAKEGDATVEYLKKNGITNIILFKDYKDIILAAKDEKIKVFTVDEPCAIYYLNKYNILEKFKEGFILYTGEFHRAVRKGNEPILEFVENGFNKIPKNTYTKLKNKWFGVEFKKEIPTRLILIIILVITILSVLFIINSITLTKLVAKRTKELQISNSELEKEKVFLESLFEVIPDIVITYDNEFNEITSFLPAIYNNYKVELMNEFKTRLKKEIENLKIFETQSLYNCIYDIYIDSKKNVFDVRLLFSKKGFYLLLARDITEKSIFEQSLLEKQKLEIIGTLASGVAHDMNNILHSVLSIASLIKMMLDEDEISRENLREYVDILEKSALKGSSFISSLLNFSRDSKGVKSEFDLINMIKNSVEIFNSKYKKKIIAEFFTDLKQATFYGVENEIMQVILNILINSYESIERKNNLEKGFIKVTLEKEDKFFRIDIEDNGEGIAKNIEDKIFNPFFTTKGQGLGVGIGLTIAKKILIEHDGFIKFHNTENSTTIFSIYLPLFQKENDMENSIQIFVDQNIKNLENIKIFLVDDDTNVLEVTKKGLEKKGFIVLAENKVEDAKKVFEKNFNDISICIVDLVMPEMNGLELLRYFKNIGYKGKNIISTGYKDDSRLKEVNDIKIDYIIEKPYNLNEIYKIILSIINESSKDFQ